MSIALFFAKAFFGRIFGFLKGLSPRAWLIIGIVAALVIGVMWHRHEITKAEKRGAAAENARLAEQARKLKAKVDGLTIRIAQAERSRNDAENRRITAAADALRVRGPGRALCPRLPAAPGGHVEAIGIGDAAGPQVSAGDSAAVPWLWLVGRAEEHDKHRAEAEAWRRWYAELVKAWPKP